MSEEIVLAPGASPPELANIANREHGLVSVAAGSMVDHAILAGQALEAAKIQVNHGGWLEWLDANFEGSRQTAADYMRVAANPDVVRSLHPQRLSINAVLKRIERVNRERQPVLEQEATPAVVDDCDIRLGDFRDQLADEAGVDTIITDPPYPAEFIEEFDALGEVAARILKPDGFLVAMVGQTHLPAYLERLSRHLAYRWCGAYLTEGPATRIHGRKVGTKWKPLLIFGGEEFITQDVFSSEGDDKQHHHWGQSESGFADIVSRLTSPGELVVDPFLGGGTTAVVCRDLGRRFIGCDKDPEAVRKTLERLG